MQEEVESLLKNETWELVKLPENESLVASGSLREKKGSLMLRVEGIKQDLL